MDKILKYFPTLTQHQQEQLQMLEQLYLDWNAKINVISRKDIAHLYEHHVLHSLAIARFVEFKAETNILDFGTGGGFPGIPLAIMFPNCHFTLIDGTGKKVQVAQAIAESIKLTNVKTKHIRGEEEKGIYHFVVSRAVMPLPDLVKIIRKNIDSQQMNALPNGLICLKGGELTNEVSNFKRIVRITPIYPDFNEPWFEDKKVVYIPL